MTTELDGILLFMGFILIILAFLHFYNRRNVEIGFICFILGTAPFYTHFSQDLQGNFIANILLGLYRAIFIPVLLYIFLIKSILSKKLNNSNIIRYFIAPSTIVFVYLVIKFGFNSFYLKNFKIIVTTFWGLIIVVTILYSVKTLKLFHNSSEIINTSVLNRYKVLVSITNGFILISLIVNFLRFYFPFLLDEKFGMPILYCLYTIHIIAVMSIILMAFFELNVVKKYFLSRDIHLKSLAQNKEQTIKSFIEKTLKVEKPFKDSNFDLKTYLLSKEINSKEFGIFTKKEYKITPAVYINKLRVEEFIHLMNNPDMALYDIQALSDFSGFKSKATFYRVFKQITGLTPKEYNASLKKSN